MGYYLGGFVVGCLISVVVFVVERIHSRDTD